MEEWKTINEFPNYSISSEGRVRNDQHRRLVKTSITRGGHIKVGLVGGRGYQETRGVKLLVAEAFVSGYSETYSTPINLDCDPSNNRVENLAWRPRWFAIQYKIQMNKVQWYETMGPIININTKDIYENVIVAGITEGLLFTHIVNSLSEGHGVFPTWDHYMWLIDYEG